MTKYLGFILRYHRSIHAIGELSMFVLVLASAVLIFVEPAKATQVTLDPIQTRIRTELNSFTSWLSETGSKGYIGEVGWPDNTGGDAASWNALASIWYQDADKANLWVTPWSTGIWWGTSYKLSPYQQKTAGAGVNSPNTQASVLEANPPTANYRRGVNVSGAEFGTGGSFNNTNPGTYGTNYIYDPSTTFSYLASRNENIVRMPIRWERIQPTLGGALDTAELQRLTDAVNRAGASGLGVILDLHNYGEYQTSGGRQTIGQGVSVAEFDEVWQLLSQSFKNNNSVVAYDIMNEPHDIGGTNPAHIWEQASQSALTTIRTNGDNKLIMIPGYNWSGVASWVQTHTAAWINDPSNNFRYEAHHYWDRDSSGVYASSYATEVANAVSRGYTTSQYSGIISPIIPTPIPPASNTGAGTPTSKVGAVSANATPTTLKAAGVNTQALPTKTNTGITPAVTPSGSSSIPLSYTQRVQNVLVKSADQIAKISVLSLLVVLFTLFLAEVKLRRLPSPAKKFSTLV